MKLLMLLGGVLGFTIGYLSSWSQENSWSYCLWHASLAAYVGGWLTAWWGRVWQHNLKSSVLEQQARAAAAAMAAPSIPKTSKS